MHPYEDYKFQLSKESSMSFVRFPKKLWKIVNECNSGAISWSPDGKAVVIEYDKFQKQYLNGQREMFKTNNINSFIRQLNLYGFRKVSSHYKVICANQHGGADVHVFRNAAFLRGRPELLSRVTRKSGLMRPKALQHEDDDDSANLLPRHNRRGHGTDAGVRGVSAQGRSLPRRSQRRCNRAVRPPAATVNPLTAVACCSAGTDSDAITTTNEEMTAAMQRFMHGARRNEGYIPNGDIKALLDPDQAPTVVLHHQGERPRTPLLEESLTLNSMNAYLSDESTSDTLSTALMIDECLSEQAEFMHSAIQHIAANQHEAIHQAAVQHPVVQNVAFPHAAVQEANWHPAVLQAVNWNPAVPNAPNRPMAVHRPSVIQRAGVPQMPAQYPACQNAAFQHAVEQAAFQNAANQHVPIQAPTEYPAVQLAGFQNIATQQAGREDGQHAAIQHAPFEHIDLDYTVIEEAATQQAATEQAAVQQVNLYPAPQHMAIQHVALQHPAIQHQVDHHVAFEQAEHAPFQPVAFEYAPFAHMASEHAASQPATFEPAASVPMPFEPTTFEPAVSQQASTKHASFMCTDAINMAIKKMAIVNTVIKNEAIVKTAIKTTAFQNAGVQCVTVKKVAIKKTTVEQVALEQMTLERGAVHQTDDQNMDKQQAIFDHAVDIATVAPVAAEAQC